MKNNYTLNKLVIILLVSFTFSSYAQNDIAFSNLYIQNIAQINDSAKYDGFYSHRPTNQIIPILFVGDVENVGTFDQTDVYFYASVTDSMNSIVYNDSAYASLLNISDTSSLASPNYFTPAGNNNYTAVMNCEQAEIDANPLDNVSESINFSISDERKIKRYNEYNNNFSPAQYGGGDFSIVEVTFTVAETDTISSLSVFLDSTCMGGIVIAHLIRYGIDTIALLTSEEYFIQQTDIGNWITLTFLQEGNNNEILEPNYRYVASLELFPMNDLVIGTDTTGYHDYLIETKYIIANGTTTFIQYLEETPLIAINFSMPDTSTINISNIGVEIKLELFPNPANNILNVNCEKEIQSIAIYKQTGQLVLQTKANTQKQNIDISTLQVGSYFMRVVGKDNVWTEKFVVIR